MSRNVRFAVIDGESTKVVPLHKNRVKERNEKHRWNILTQASSVHPILPQVREWNHMWYDAKDPEDGRPYLLLRSTAGRFISFSKESTIVPMLDGRLVTDPSLKDSKAWFCALSALPIWNQVDDTQILRIISEYAVHQPIYFLSNSRCSPLSTLDADELTQLQQRLSPPRLPAGIESHCYSGSNVTAFVIPDPWDYIRTLRNIHFYISAASPLDRFHISKTLIHRPVDDTFPVFHFTPRHFGHMQSLFIVVAPLSLFPF